MGFMKSLGHEHQPENWRLFIDANKHSLKAVLLHNKNDCNLTINKLLLSMHLGQQRRKPTL